ncbi:MAG: TIGR03118 family protein [Opitutaceae bacterium]
MNADLIPLPLAGSVSQNQSIARLAARSFVTHLVSVLSVGTVLGLSSPARAQHYQQTNLVSDVPGLAAVTHLPLVNPWGLTRSATSPWWVSDNGAGVSTLYNGAGTPLSLIVTVPIPPSGTPPSTPTGTVFNGTTDFQVGPGQPARFIFVTEDGTISGWNPTADATNAILKVDHSATAVYKGVTLGQRNGANFLYAANFRAGRVEVYDANFAWIDLGPEAFGDSKLPAGFAPFNVQNINGTIYVTFAKQDAQQHDEVDGAGLGYVDAFSTDGILLMRLKSGPWLNAPWGVAWAPAGFGHLSGKLLVGNFGSGKIAAYDPRKGNFQGMLLGPDDEPLAIEGLWALDFGNGAGAGPATTLYFTAGINGEADGLFGTITPIAESDND